MRIPSIKALGLSVGMSVNQVKTILGRNLGHLQDIDDLVHNKLVIRCTSWSEPDESGERVPIPNGLALLFNENRQFLGFSRSPKYAGLTCSKGTSKPRKPFRRCRKDAGTTREVKS